MRFDFTFLNFNGVRNSKTNFICFIAHLNLYLTFLAPSKVMRVNSKRTLSALFLKRTPSFEVGYQPYFLGIAYSLHSDANERR